MATGASTCDLAIILIDARHGVQVQTRRHSFIVSLLGIKHIVVAINKMDLVAYSEQVFNRICEQYRDVARQLELDEITFIPLSALQGDNIIAPSDNTPWYHGTTLLGYLETVEVDEARLQRAPSACRCSGSTAPIRVFAVLPAPWPAA